MKFTHRSLDREELKEEMIEEDGASTMSFQSTHNICMKELGIWYANDVHLDVAVIAQVTSFLHPNSFGIRHTGNFIPLFNRNSFLFYHLFHS
jgi:hypothetical protein